MLLRSRLLILVATALAAGATSWGADAPSTAPADAPSVTVPSVTLPGTTPSPKAAKPAKPAKSTAKEGPKDPASAAADAKPEAGPEPQTVAAAPGAAPRAPEAMPALMPAVGPQPAASAPDAAASAPEAGASAPADAASAPAGPPAPLDTRVQEAKADVIQLNRDLLVLEEELLFPANTQVALFVSMDVGKMFELDSVQVKLDDKVVANYLYTPREVQALHRGGVQRVYLGNLKTGEHELVAFFTGKGPHDRDYKRGATVKFDKGTEAKYIELRIRDSSGRLQPEFDVKTWQ